MVGKECNVGRCRDDGEAGRGAGNKGKGHFVRQIGKQTGKQIKQDQERPTRVCWYLRAFLCDASAAIDTLSLIQK